MGETREALFEYEGRPDATYERILSERDSLRSELETNKQVIETLDAKLSMMRSMLMEVAQSDPAWEFAQRLLRSRAVSTNNHIPEGTG